MQLQYSRRGHVNSCQIVDGYSERASPLYSPLTALLLPITADLWLHPPTAPKLLAALVFAIQYWSLSTKLNNNLNIVRVTLVVQSRLAYLVLFRPISLKPIIMKLSLKVPCSKDQLLTLCDGLLPDIKGLRFLLLTRKQGSCFNLDRNVYLVLLQVGWSMWAATAPLCLCLDWQCTQRARQDCRPGQTPLELNGPNMALLSSHLFLVYSLVLILIHIRLPFRCIVGKTKFALRDGQKLTLKIHF